jgi:Acetyltransferase (GNAT) domain
MHAKRIYLGYLGEELVAGMICIDEGVTSEYYVSFYEPASRPYHFGIALMDRWYHDSRILGMRYCDLDHMRDIGQSLGYRGYTVFKSGIADHDAYCHDLYIRFF